MMIRRCLILYVSFLVMHGYAATSTVEGTDLCKPNPCNSGICTTGEGEVSCICPESRQGEFCEINPCSTNPCQNGGNCSLSEEDEFICTCPKGYTGSLCDIDLCQQNPCNDERCAVNNNCICDDLNIGKNCEKKPCDSSPCQNGGKCLTHEAGNFSCKCLDGYKGKTCETESCDPNPCDNGGSCYGGGERPVYCICAGYYFGPRCKESPCQDNPCQNSGTCVETGNKKDDFLCECTPGYAGDKCESVSCLIDNPCQNHGKCEVTEGNLTCHCSPPYVGMRCESMITSGMSTKSNPVTTPKSSTTKKSNSNKSSETSYVTSEGISTEDSIVSPLTHIPKTTHEEQTSSLSTTVTTRNSQTDTVSVVISSVPLTSDADKTTVIILNSTLSENTTTDTTRSLTTPSNCTNSLTTTSTDNSDDVTTTTEISESIHTSKTTTETEMYNYTTPADVTLTTVNSTTRGSKSLDNNTDHVIETSTKEAIHPEYSSSIITSINNTDDVTFESLVTTADISVDEITFTNPNLSTTNKFTSTESESAAHTQKSTTENIIDTSVSPDKRKSTTSTPGTKDTTDLNAGATETLKDVTSSPEKIISNENISIGGNATNPPTNDLQTRRESADKAMTYVGFAVGGLLAVMALVILTVYLKRVFKRRRQYYEQDDGTSSEISADFQGSHNDLV